MYKKNLVIMYLDVLRFRTDASNKFTQYHLAYNAIYTLNKSEIISTNTFVYKVHPKSYPPLES